MPKNSNHGNKYIWSDQDPRIEMARLRLLEDCFDPLSTATLASIDLQLGSSCLEAGAGAGSIARWLADRVGPHGKVVAIDKDVRFLASFAAYPNVEVRVADVFDADFEPSSFDLVHARMLLLHIPERERILRCFCNSLRPGGVLVLEEPDLSTLSSCVSEPETAAVERVFGAVIALHQQFGADPFVGRRLPALVRRAGFVETRAKGSILISHGGDPHSQWAANNVLALRGQLVAANLATDDDIAAFVEQVQDEANWFVGFNMVTVLAQCPARIKCPLQADLTIQENHWSDPG